jgi:F0F1-type ATP synthase assembly protein I
MKKSLLFALSFIGSVGFTTAVPVVALGLLGRYLDQRYETSPKFLIILLALSVVIVFFTLKKIVKEAIENFKKIN